MSISCVSCSCGNIQMKGTVLYKSKCLSIHIDRPENFHFYKNIFVFNQNSFEIKKSKQLKKFYSNNSFMNLKCKKCGICFHLTCKDKIYLQQFIILNSKNKNFLQKKDIKMNDLNDHDWKSNNIDCKFNVDCDFELMFSNKDEPFVGSYKQEFSVSKDEM